MAEICFLVLPGFSHFVADENPKNVGLYATLSAG